MRHAGDSIHTARGGAIVLCLQRCTMRCQIELCAGVIYLIRGQDTQIMAILLICRYRYNGLLDIRAGTTVITTIRRGPRYNETRNE